MSEGISDIVDSLIHNSICPTMRIIYIAHPIAGNVEANLKSIRAIVKDINEKYHDVVPLVSYYADVVSLGDDVPELRARGIKNGLAIIKKKEFLDEMWVFGKVISPGVKKEIITALECKIPVLAKNPMIYDEVEEIKKHYRLYGIEKWV